MGWNWPVLLSTFQVSDEFHVCGAHVLVWRALTYTLYLAQCSIPPAKKIGLDWG